jgi:ankyrin repeat protein
MSAAADDVGPALPYIHEASKRGHADQVRDCIAEDKSSVNSMDPLHNTPLLWAVMGDHVDCVKLLLDSGADINHKNLNDDTALHRASWRNAEKSIPILLAAGADKQKELKNKDGKTAADLARPIEIRQMVAPQVVDDGEDYDFDESDDGESSDD